MYGKILISCNLVVRTGLHIGAASGFSAIGAEDSPVVRDPLTGYPVVPGSSLKGKLRTLLSHELDEGWQRDTQKYKNCWDADPPVIKRLFGSSNPIQAARLQFADCPIVLDASAETRDLKPSGTTEVKVENSITRDWYKENGRANPRQIERVIPGISFAVRIVYDARKGIEAKETVEDLGYLATAMRLLQRDYLGGHGSRGSGRISFLNFKLSPYPEGTDVGELEKLFVPVEQDDPFFNGETGSDGGDNADGANSRGSEEGGKA